MCDFKTYRFQLLDSLNRLIPTAAIVTTRVSLQTRSKMDKYQSPRKACVTRVNLVQMSRKCIVFSQTFNAIQGTPQQVIEWPKWILGTERRRMGHFSLFKANSQVIRKKVHIWFRRLWFFIGFSYPVFGAHGPRLESTWEPAIVFYISHLIQMESFAKNRPTKSES